MPLAEKLLSRLSQVQLLLPRTPIITVFGVAAILAGCSSPGRPTTSLVGSRPTSPSNGSAFSYYSQPVTLVVAGGVTTGSGSITSIVEVATDSAFTTITTTQAANPDASGRLTVTLDHLSPARTYYWRVKTSAGDNGAVSASQSFSIGPLLVIQAPTPVQPLADTFPHKRPTFIVINAVHTGPDAMLTYRFDVAADSAFSTVVTSGTSNEGASQTSFTPGVDLTPGTTYYWRAQASDTTKQVAGGRSLPQVFTTVFQEDGAFRYTLAIQAPTYCLTHSVHTGVNGNIWGSGWTISHFTFAGTLTVRSDKLQFTPDESWVGQSSLLGFGRARNQLAGSISGMQSYPLVGSAPGFNGVGFSGVVTGTSDNQGLFEGTFDGTTTLDREGMPHFNTDTCSTSGFTWTLTPR